MPYKNEHSARLLDPNTNHIRVGRTHGSKKAKVQGVIIPTTIDVIWYVIKDEDGKEYPRAQALRFPVKTWTEKQSKDWLNDKEIKYLKFEPASKQSKNSEGDIISKENYKFKTKSVSDMTVDDVDTYRKGLTPDQKKKYVKTVKEAMNSCLAANGSSLECEVLAIRQANSIFRKKKKKHSEIKYEAEDIPPFEIDGGKTVNIAMRLNSSEIILKDDGEEDKYNMVLPIGTFWSGWYGEIIITPSYCQTMVDNWKSKILGNREPFVDELHRRAEAFAWIKDIEVRTDGLYILPKWNDKGINAITNEYYRYFSCDIGEVVDIENGDRVYPVLVAVSLCNTPVMNTMPRAKLSDEINPTHSDGKNLNEEYKEMNSEEFKTLMDSISNMTDEQRKQLNNATGMTDEQYKLLAEALTVKDAKNNDSAETVELKLTIVKQSEEIIELKKQLSEKQKETEQERSATKAKVDALTEQNTKLSETINSMTAEKLKNECEEEVTKAVKNFQILPKDADKWKEWYMENPEGIKAILAIQPRVVATGDVGTGSGGEEDYSLSEDDIKAAKIAGMTVKEYAEFQKKGGTK